MVLTVTMCMYRDSLKLYMKSRMKYPLAEAVRLWLCFIQEIDTKNYCTLCRIRVIMWKTVPC